MTKLRVNSSLQLELTQILVKLFGFERLELFSLQFVRKKCFNILCVSLLSRAPHKNCKFMGSYIFYCDIYLLKWFLSFLVVFVQV